MGWLPFAVTLPFIASLLASGVWADRHFDRFEKLPAHFDISGKATRLAPRRTMVWLLPTLFSAILVFTALLGLVVPPEQQDGYPVAGVMFSGGALLAAQGFVLWLTERWARNQP